MRKIKFSVATNWDDQLVEYLHNFPDVTEVYGKLSSDFVGGARASMVLPEVSKRRVANHIKKIHDNGMEFNYLLNTLCMGNREFTRKGQKELHKVLRWLKEINVDRITIAIPYLAQFIKSNYPNFKLNVSIGAFVRDIEIAKYWENLGIDSIALQSSMLNRDFKRIRYIREHVDCDLQLVANNGCIYYCPYYQFHHLLLSHASQSQHYTKGYMVDYYFMNCRLKRLKYPEYIIRADWIRPEDVGIYEDLGIDSLKIVDRSMPTKMLKKIVKAYNRRWFDGNLLELLGTFYGIGVPYSFRRKLKSLKYFFKPQFVNIFKLIEIAELRVKMDISVDNRSLDGFLDYIIRKGGCGIISCNECGYCKKVSEEVVQLSEVQQDFINKYEKILDEINKGTFFSYNIFH